jgi:hypothetical protein
MVAFYSTHPDLKRFGFLLLMYGGAILTPFLGTIAYQLWQGREIHKLAAFIQVFFGTALMIEFVFPPMFLEAAAFRLGRSPDAVLALSDVGWLFYVGMVATFVVEMVLLGLLILQDDSTRPVFPKWLGYTNLVCAPISSLGGLCVFFQTGPFAWGGFLSFWVALASYGVWTIAMTVVLLRNIGQLEPVALPAPESVLA